jgi:ribosomal protein L35AE/L33A
MVTRTKIISSLLLILLTSTAALAGDGPVRLRPDFKPGDENRYLITAAVATSVEPAGENGISSSSRREVTATILLRTVGVGQSGEVSQEAIIEAASSSAAVNGVEAPSKAGTLVGKKIVFTINSSGHLLKCSMPELASELGLADMLFAMARWFPHEDRAVGHTWKASGQGPVYADGLSEISKNSTTDYRVTAVDKNTASIEGAVSLSQSGASVLSTGNGRLNINVAASGSGRTRFDYDIAGRRITGGETETRLEGRLSNILPTAAGQKMLTREGSLVETARFSIKLLKV